MHPLLGGLFVTARPKRPTDHGDPDMLSAHLAEDYCGYFEADFINFTLYIVLSSCFHWANITCDHNYVRNDFKIM